MSNTDILTTAELRARYPLSAKYDVDWIVENHLGSHCLWLMESLCAAMNLRPGMRVLDLGCGRAISSIFLAKEFGLQVWATDLWVPATENLTRIQTAGVADRVFPLYAEARQLPFAEGFFDAIVGINSLQYFGTDDMYLEKYLITLVKPEGQLGMVLPGFIREFTEIPAHIKPYWGAALYNWHSAAWWRWHWEKTGMVTVEMADNLPDDEGFQVFYRWEQVVGDVKLCEADQGRNVTFVRLVGRRK